MLKNVATNYKKGVYQGTLIRKLKVVDLSIKELVPPIGPGRKVALDIAKKRYEIQLKKTLIE